MAGSERAHADPDLVARAQAGSRVAVQQLLTEARPWIQSFAENRLWWYANRYHLAEDVAQETLVALVPLLTTWEDRGLPFYALVYKVAGNKVADMQRWLGRNTTEILPADYESRDPAPQPEDIVIARDDLAHAWRLMGKLPRVQTHALALRGQGYSADEVGAVLGMTANAVRVAQHRGLKRLRELIQAEDSGLRGEP